ncbi:MAG: hypothetical protein WAK29_01240, partial [Terriglobales bacterium]
MREKRGRRWSSWSGALRGEAGRADLGRPEAVWPEARSGFDVRVRGFGGRFFIGEVPESHGVGRFSHYRAVDETSQLQ